ncbi:MAG: hypothetical protein ABIJ46_04035 [bacterium]
MAAVFLTLLILLSQVILIEKEVNRRRRLLTTVQEEADQALEENDAEQARKVMAIISVENWQPEEVFPRDRKKFKILLKLVDRARVAQTEKDPFNG